MSTFCSSQEESKQEAPDPGIWEAAWGQPSLLTSNNYMNLLLLSLFPKYTFIYFYYSLCLEHLIFVFQNLPFLHIWLRLAVMTLLLHGLVAKHTGFGAKSSYSSDSWVTMRIIASWAWDRYLWGRERGNVVQREKLNCSTIVAEALANPGRSGGGMILSGFSNWDQFVPYSHHQAKPWVRQLLSAKDNSWRDQESWVVNTPSLLLEDECLPWSQKKLWVAHHSIHYKPGEYTLALPLLAVWLQISFLTFLCLCSLFQNSGGNSNFSFLPKDYMS